MRLDKRITTLGLTRAQAKRLIARGEVRVNGEVERDAGRIVTDADDVRAQGTAAAAAGHTHLMLFKPAGVLTATRDGRETTVLDLIPAPPRGLGPVGRLDKDVTGLILLTTDGQLAHRLIAPRFEIGKLYRARVEGTLDEGCVEAFRQGVPLADFTAKSANLSIEAPGTALVEVFEGKYHQVKRMFAAIGHPVVALERLRIGEVWLDSALAPGESRPLTAQEAESLYRAVRLDPAHQD